MPDSAEPSRISRRTLLKAGIAGGAGLLLARWLYTSTTTVQSTSTPYGALDAGARAIVAAIAPVMLDGALPANDPVSLQRDCRGRRAGDRRPAAGGAQGGRPAVRAAVVGTDPCSGRRRMVAVARGVAGIDRRLSRSAGATADSALLRSAYGALHQLVFAAWYGNPQAWPAIGYAGPPSLEVG